MENGTASFLKECGKEAVKSVISGAGSELGKQAVEFGINVGKELVRSYGMWMLASGVVNVAHGMIGKKRNIRLVHNYRPLGKVKPADFDLVFAAAKALVEHHRPPPVKPKAALKAKAKAQMDKAARLLKNLALAFLGFSVVCVRVKEVRMIMLTVALFFAMVATALSEMKAGAGAQQP